MARISHDKWIAEVVNELQDGAPCSSLSVSHREGSLTKEIYSVIITKDTKINPLEIAELFRRKAESHVQDLPGNQLFELQARYGGRSDCSVRLPFRISGSSEAMYGETEPPTPEGKQMQSMRWGEFGHQFWAKQVTELVRIGIDRERVLSSSLEEANKENREIINLLKTALLEQASSQHQFKLEEMKFQRETMVYGELARYAPALLNTVTGRELIPQSSADSALVESMIEHLTPQQVEAMKHTFPPKVFAIIMARANEYWSKKVAAEKTAAEAVGEEPKAAE